jgi:osmoprotectant transport system ATP-binding protein
MPSPAAAAGDPAVRLRGVTKRFAGAASAAVEGLELDVPRGSVVALIGPSGCGKTTTLRMINRLLDPTAGVVEVDGVDVSTVDPIALRLGIGYVIQAVGLFPHRTIRDNIAVVPRALGWGRHEIAARVEELVDLVGLAPELLDRYPDELSGGQQQRVGVARALAADPPILLMDEPFGAVDPVVRARLQVELVTLQARLQRTIVLVTHDLDEAVAVADRVALLDVGGRLAQMGSPEELLRAPSEPFVVEFLGGERALRRLALQRVGDLVPPRGPVVDRRDDADALRTVLGTAPDWIGVVDDGRFLGWVSAATAAAVAVPAQLTPEVAGTRIARDASVRASLDALLTDLTAAVVVEDDAGRFVGTLRLDDVRARLGGGAADGLGAGAATPP